MGSKGCFLKFLNNCVVFAYFIIRMTNMRHSGMTLLIIASILFVGVENVVDELLDDHAISSPHAHAQITDDPLSSDDHEGDSHHCGHCFHSHTGDIADALESRVIPATTLLLSYHEPNFLAYLQAPPTPPPNA